MKFESSTVPPTGPPLIPDGHLLDFSRTGIPWVDRLLDTAAVIVLVVMVVCAVGFIAWTRWIHPVISKLQVTAEKAAKDAAVTREHTENSHGSAKNPNLRDDLDAKFAESNQNLEAIAKMVSRVEAGQVRHDKELARLQDSVTADREATRHIGERLDSHIRDKQSFEPRLSRLEHQLEAHREITEDS